MVQTGGVKVARRGDDKVGACLLWLLLAVAVRLRDGQKVSLLGLRRQQKGPRRLLSVVVGKIQLCVVVEGIQVKQGGRG